MRNSFLVLVALLGFLISALVIYQGRQDAPPAPLVVIPPSSPYKKSIAGQGIIEYAYKNRAIGSSYSDIITTIYVQVGEEVKKGAPLFTTDTRKFIAQRAQALQELALAQEELKNQTIQFGYYADLVNKNAVSKLAYTTAEYAQKNAAHKVLAAEAAINLYTTEIERSTVCAPIDGEILQLNIREGELVTHNTNADNPLILFGNTKEMHVRIDIDEEDAWRYKKRARAIAYVRGNRKIEIPLEYVYLEPYIIAKKSLSGGSLELVDTRVLQVIYRFKKNKLPVYAGQLLDIYIEDLEGQQKSL